MGALWKDRKTPDLILNYNGILWGLKERFHCRVRKFGKVNYVIPQVCTEEYFKQQIEPGMLAAKETIETILAERNVQPIPELRLVVMTSDEADMRDVGWETYKQMQLAMLKMTGRRAA